MVGWLYVAYDTVKTSEIEVFRSLLIADASQRLEVLDVPALLRAEAERIA
ncbi:hypothetical protein [Candidatus Poriferisodalis sp.]